MVKDSLIWKLTANVANTCAQSCLYTVLLPQAYNVPICSSLFYCLFTLNLFSIHSPSTLSPHSCLCTSPWLFPILSIYFPLGLALSILFALNFYLCFWELFQFIYSLRCLTLAPIPSVSPTLFWPLSPNTIQLLSLCVISSSRFSPLIISKTLLLDSDYSTRDLQLASSPAWTWYAMMFPSSS